MAFPTGWTLQNQIDSDYTKVSGSANLTNFPALLTEDNFTASVFSNSQGKEINSNYLLNDANLQAYYRFEGNSTDTKNAYNGTDTNISYSASYGKFGQGASFNGSSSKIVLSSSVPSLTDNWSYSFWIKLGATGVQHSIYNRQNSTSSGRQIYIYVTTANKLNVDIPYIKGNVITSNYTFNATAWVFCTITRSGSTWNMYINGVLDKTVTDATAQESSTDDPDLGTVSASQWLNGYLDDFAIFNKVLTATEVKAIYTGGADLRFTTDEAGTTQIPHEVVNWDIDNSEAEVWVKIPTLSYTAATTIYVWTNNSDGTPLARTDTYGSDNVWTNGYVGVYHLNGNLIDSTANAYNLTPVNGPFSNTTGKFGGASNGAVDLVSASSQYADNTNSAFNITGDYTLQAWHKPDDNTDVTPAGGIVTDANNYGALYKIRLNSSAYPNGNTWASSGSFLDVTWASAQSTGTWLHQAFVKDADNDWNLLVNGVSRATSTSTRTLSTTGKNGFRIGANEGSGGSSTPSGSFYDGAIDEVRISNVARTDDWLLTEYNNQNSPSTFWIEASIATEVSVSDSVSLSESVSVSLQEPTVFEISVSDEVSVSESAVVTPLSIQKSVSDSVSISESVILAMSTSEISVSDAVTVTDEIPDYYGEEILVQESVNVEVVDTNPLISVSESISLADTPNVLVGEPSFATSDGIGVSESLSVEVQQATTREVSISDSVSVDEVLLASLEDLEASTSDSVSVNESNSTDPVLISTVVSDGVTVTESLVVTLPEPGVLYPIGTDNISISENIQATTSTPGASPSDQVLINESINVSIQDATSLSISTYDSVIVDESVSLSLPSLTVLSSDGVSVSESVIVTEVLNITQNETISVTESTAGSIGSLSLSVYEEVSTSDSPTANTYLEVSVSEGVGVSESIGAYSVEEINLSGISEGVSISEDILVAISDLGVLVSEGVVVSESVGGVVSLQVSVSDSLSLSEAVYTTKVYNISVDDSLTVTDTLISVFKGNLPSGKGISNIVPDKPSIGSVSTEDTGISDLYSDKPSIGNY